MPNGGHGPASSELTRQILEVLSGLRNGTVTRDEARQLILRAYEVAGIPMAMAQGAAQSLTDPSNLAAYMQSLTAGNAPPNVAAAAQPVTQTADVLPGADKAFWTKVAFPETDPFAAWQRARGLPAVGRNPFQEWVAGQATPAFAGWGARAAERGTTPSLIPPVIATPGPITLDPFSAYTAQPGGGQMGQREAYRVLQQMRGQPGPQQQSWMDILGSTGGPGLGNVLEAGLRGKGYAGFVANALANRLPALRTGWSAQTMGGAEPDVTLLNYLMREMGV